MGKTTRIRMPALETAEAKRLWKFVTSNFEIDSAKATLLETACRSFDNYLKYDRLLKQHGPIYKAGGLIKRNPLCDLIRVERAGFLQAMKDLDLEEDGELQRRVGRPLGRSV